MTVVKAFFSTASRVQQAIPYAETFTLVLMTWMAPSFFRRVTGSCKVLCRCSLACKLQLVQCSLCNALQGFMQDSTHCLAGAAESGVGLASALAATSDVAAAGLEPGLETKRLSASSMRVSRLLASVRALSSSSTCTHIHTLGL